jgi:hypothetical protein
MGGDGVVRLGDDRDMAAREKPMTLTDAGLETVLILEEGVELPCFAAFPLLDSDKGRAVLRRYYDPFLRLARDRGAGFVLSSPTWRANRDWGEELGYDTAALAAANRRAVAFLEEVRDDVLAPAARTRSCNTWRSSSGLRAGYRNRRCLAGSNGSTRSHNPSAPPTTSPSSTIPPER